MINEFEEKFENRKVPERVIWISNKCINIREPTIENDKRSGLCIPGHVLGAFGDKKEGEEGKMKNSLGKSKLKLQHVEGFA